MSENQGNGMIAGFILGAAVGAGIALLMAPASGEDSRRRLKQTAQDLGGNAKDIAGSAREKLTEVSRNVREAAHEFTRGVKEGQDHASNPTAEPVMPSRRV